jgi:hypothetical protein
MYLLLPSQLIHLFSLWGWKIKFKGLKGTFITFQIVQNISFFKVWVVQNEPKKIIHTHGN